VGIRAFDAGNWRLVDPAEKRWITDYAVVPVFEGTGDANDVSGLKVKKYSFYELKDIEG
jgi:hypothetical protein